MRGFVGNLYLGHNPVHDLGHFEQDKFRCVLAYHDHIMTTS